MRKMYSWNCFSLTVRIIIPEIIDRCHEKIHLISLLPDDTIFFLQTLFNQPLLFIRFFLHSAKYIPVNQCVASMCCAFPSFHRNHVLNRFYLTLMFCEFSQCNNTFSLPTYHILTLGQDPLSSPFNTQGTL